MEHLFDKMSCSVTAIAAGETFALSIDRKKLFPAINRDPTLVFKIIDTLTRKMRSLIDEVLNLRNNRLEFFVCSEIDRTCSLLHEEIKNLCNVDNASIMLLDDKEETLSIKVAFGSHAKSRISFTRGKGIAGQVLMTGKAEMINDVSQDRRFVQGAVKIKSLICLPLKYSDCIFGVINVSNGSTNVFSSDDLHLLNLLSIYASIAIHNAKTSSSLKEEANQVIKNAKMIYMT